MLSYCFSKRLALDKGLQILFDLEVRQSSLLKLLL